MKTEYFFETREINLGTALHSAIRGPNLNYISTNTLEEMISFLLEHSARADIVDGEGRTPLQLAQHKQMEGVIRVFEKYAAED